MTAFERVLRRAGHLLRHDDWTIGVIDQPVEAVLDGAPLGRVDWAPARRGRYAADPFGLPAQDGDGIDVVFEDYVHATGVASLAHRRWDPSSGWGEVETVLAAPAHHSYPFLTAHPDGGLLLLPEAHASGTLTLYRSDRVRGPWRPAAVLPDGDRAADPTLLYRDGRWWFFAVRADPAAPNTHLALRWADDLSGPWHAHAADPVLSDAGCARPAGPIVEVGGRLLRPAQDCSRDYGARVVVRRIEQLSPTHYTEVTERTIEPVRAGGYGLGLHTIVGVGSRTLIDGKRRVWDLGASRRVLRARRAVATPQPRPAA